MRRWYLCEITGDGSDDDSFRPASADIAPGADWGGTDGRADDTIGGGWMLTRVDVDASQHATLLADARVQYIPLEENGTGRVLDLDDRITLIRGSVRSQIAAALEARHIPTDDFDATTTVRQLLRRIMRRALMRRLLGGDDYTELLASTIGDIPAAKRQRVAERLTWVVHNRALVTARETPTTTAVTVNDWWPVLTPQELRIGGIGQPHTTLTAQAPFLTLGPDTFPCQLVNGRVRVLGITDSELRERLRTETAEPWTRVAFDAVASAPQPGDSLYWLRPAGYDLSSITLATPVRTALRMLAAQSVSLNRTMVD